METGTDPKLPGSWSNSVHETPYSVWTPGPTGRRPPAKLQTPVLFGVSLALIAGGTWFLVAFEIPVTFSTWLWTCLGLAVVIALVTAVNQLHFARLRRSFPSPLPPSGAEGMNRDRLSRFAATPPPVRTLGDVSEGPPSD